MGTVDVHGVTATEQELLRRRAVALVCEGKPQREVARLLGVSHSAIAKWLHAWRTAGDGALDSHPRGRPVGTGTLSAAAMHTVLDALYNSTPDQLGLSERLWCNTAIRELIQRQRSRRVAATTVSLWMRQWGFCGPHPCVDRGAAYDDAVSSSAIWRFEEYRRAKRYARRHHARVLLFDEPLLPVWAGMPKRPAVMLCAVDGRGVLYFRAVHPPVTARDRIDFMERLIVQIGRPVVLLLDSHRNHRSGAIRAWQREYSDRITFVHIPVTRLEDLPAACWPFGRVGVY